MNRNRFRGFWPVCFVALSLQLQACASRPALQQSSSISPDNTTINLPEIEKEILEADAGIEDSGETPALSKRSHIPIEVNKNVRKWIHYFTGKDRERFQRFLERGSRYKPLVQEILREHNVPVDLYYLAMIESGYVVRARSHANAVGIWQFIKGTGLRYGLDQNHYVDERHDVIRSTEAAAKYLNNLHTAFQSWYLAMAGYNAGEGRVLGAIMRGQGRNFWDLVEKKALPPETRDYVPKYLAAVIIGNHPEKYGFKIAKVTPFPRVDAAKVPGGISLSALAKQANIPYATLKELNPHLLRSVTPANAKEYTLWVPKGDASKVASASAVLPKLKLAKQKLAEPGGRRVASTGVHQVGKGENLTQIAKRYGISVAQLKKVNDLKSNSIPVGRKLRVQAVARTQAHPRIHRVRKGDALIPIAQQYGITLKQIKKLNDLKTNRVYVGQRLIISKPY